MRAKDIAAISEILALIPKWREDTGKVKDADGVEIGASLSQVNISIPGETDEEGNVEQTHATLFWDDEAQDWTLTT